MKTIEKKLAANFIFATLDEKEKKTIIDAMEEKKYSRGEAVIQQGEAGNELFVVELGHLDCTKKFDNEPQEKFLKNMNPGDVFGELALLYNAPRYHQTDLEQLQSRLKQTASFGLWTEKLLLI